MMRHSTCHYFDAPACIARESKHLEANTYAFQNQIVILGCGIFRAWQMET